MKLFSTPSSTVNSTLLNLSKKFSAPLLTFILYSFCCAAKHYTGEHYDYTLDWLRTTLPKALASVTVYTGYFSLMSVLDAYRSGLTYRTDSFKAAVHKTIFAWIIGANISKSGPPTRAGGSLSAKSRRGEWSLMGDRSGFLFLFIYFPFLHPLPAPRSSLTCPSVLYCSVPAPSCPRLSALP